MGRVGLQATIEKIPCMQVSLQHLPLLQKPFLLLLQQLLLGLTGPVQLLQGLHLGDDHLGLAGVGGETPALLQMLRSFQWNPSW